MYCLERSSKDNSVKLAGQNHLQGYIVDWTYVLLSGSITFLDIVKYQYFNNITAGLEYSLSTVKLTKIYVLFLTDALFIVNNRRLSFMNKVLARGDHNLRSHPQPLPTNFATVAVETNQLTIVCSG